MARKKTRKFDGGGEIVVEGRRKDPSFDTGYRLTPGRMGIDLGDNAGVGTMGGASVGSAGPDQRISNLKPPMTPRTSMPVTPAVVRQPQSPLGQLVGARAPSGLGARGRFSFAEGGETKAKKKPAKKMAKGGSTASKRADGCAVKGKTKGRMV